MNPKPLSVLRLIVPVVDAIYQSLPRAEYHTPFRCKVSPSRRLAVAGASVNHAQLNLRRRGSFGTFGARVVQFSVDFSFSLEPVLHGFPMLASSSFINLMRALRDSVHSRFARLWLVPRDRPRVAAVSAACGLEFGRCPRRCDDASL